MLNRFSIFFQNFKNHAAETPKGASARIQDAELPESDVLLRLLAFPLDQRC